jgi:hypothetical protein
MKFSNFTCALEILHSQLKMFIFVVMSQVGRYGSDRIVRIVSSPSRCVLRATMTRNTNHIISLGHRSHMQLGSQQAVQAAG